MKKILLLGATGYTGTLVARALVDLGAPVTLAARNRARLESLGSELRINPPVRVIESPWNLDSALGGIGVVINTIGPFLQHSMPVVEACVTRGIDYIDTTGEQLFIKRVLDTFDAPARERGIVVLPAQGIEFTFGYCGSAALAEEFGSMTHVEIFYRTREFGMSHGTAKSILAMAASPLFEFREGHYQPFRRRWYPRRVRFPGEKKFSYGVPFPGGESIFVPRSIPSVREVSTFVIMPRLLATWLTRLMNAAPLLRAALQMPGLLSLLQDAIDRLWREPYYSKQAESTFTVLVRGFSERGIYTCQIDGRDPYGLTGRIAAQAAVWLSAGRARASGVLSTNQAFAARAMLEALAPFGLSYKLASS